MTLIVLNVLVIGPVLTLESLHRDKDIDNDPAKWDGYVETGKYEDVHILSHNARDNPLATDLSENGVAWYGIEDLGVRKYARTR